jgi:hypothetical protein
MFGSEMLFAHFVFDFYPPVGRRLKKISLSYPSNRPRNTCFWGRKDKTDEVSSLKFRGEFWKAPL